MHPHPSPALPKDHERLAPALPAADERPKPVATLTDIVGEAAEPMFDDLAELATVVCGTPIAMVCFADERRAWCKARVGTALAEVPLVQAFCACVLREPSRLLVVPDARADARFAAHPLVAAPGGARFYAGAPVLAADGQAMGAVCVLDMQPRGLDSRQAAGLQALARQASVLIELRREALDESARLQDEVARRRERLFHVAAAATQTLELQSFIDNRMTYRYVNDRFLEYWARDRESVEGRPVSDLIQPPEFDRTARPVLQRALAGEVVSGESTYSFPGAGLRHMRMDCIPVRGSDGQVAGVVVRSQDVTERERMRAELAAANEQLQRRDTARERFLHMVSHDLREPVNSICNFAGLLHERHASALDADGRRAVDFVRRAGQRLRTLLDDLLVYVRIDDHRALARREPVDLQAVMSLVLEDLSDAVQRERADLRGAPLPVVPGDPSLLRLLLQNLVSNALKYHAPGAVPVVDWGAEVADHECTVWVSDEGIGIAPEMQGRIFTAFERLVTRRQYEGTGLGLASCRRIAELHGGRISLHSRPGLGSRFSLHLPLAEGANHAQSAHGHLALPTAAGRS